MLNQGRCYRLKQAGVPQVETKDGIGMTYVIGENEIKWNQSNNSRSYHPGYLIVWLRGGKE